MQGLHTKENGTVSWNGNVIAIDKELAAHIENLQGYTDRLKSDDLPKAMGQAMRAAERAMMPLSSQSHAGAEIMAVAAIKVIKGD